MEPIPTPLPLYLANNPLDLLLDDLNMATRAEIGRGGQPSTILPDNILEAA